MLSSGLNEDLEATAVFGSPTADLFPKPRYDGVLALAGDEPISTFSTLPSHSEVAFYDAFMPTLFPGNVCGYVTSTLTGLWTPEHAL